jgi:hypothetical protein
MPRLRVPDCGPVYTASGSPGAAPACEQWRGRCTCRPALRDPETPAFTPGSGSFAGLAVGFSPPPHRIANTSAALLRARRRSFGSRTVARGGRVWCVHPGRRVRRASDGIGGPPGSTSYTGTRLQADRCRKVWMPCGGRDLPMCAAAGGQPAPGRAQGRGPPGSGSRVRQFLWRAHRRGIDASGPQGRIRAVSEPYGAAARPPHRTASVLHRTTSAWSPVPHAALLKTTVKGPWVLRPDAVSLGGMALWEAVLCRGRAEARCYTGK